MKTFNAEDGLRRHLKFFHNDMRVYLPYGKWTQSDGSEIFFNRSYKPIWMKFKSGKVTQCHPHWWVDFEREEWFYKDPHIPRVSKETFERCFQLLRDWGVINPTIEAINLETEESNLAVDQKRRMFT